MPLQPYRAAHREIKGPGDARPTALQIVNDCGATNKLRGKNILITGCSSGIGAETARALYLTGASLFLTARDMAKLGTVIDSIVLNSPSDDAKARVRPQAIEMHLDSVESVKTSSEEILSKTGGKLDILILNAGVMAGPLRYTPDGFEAQIATNHLAGFLLFHLLQPALTKAAHDNTDPARVVILSSAAHIWSPVHLRDLNWKKFSMTYNQWQAYASSKSANILMASAIDRRFKPHIRAWSVHPGGIQTELTRNLRESDFEGFGDVDAIFSTYKSVEQGAATTVWAALDPRIDSLGGQYLADCGETMPHREEDSVSAGGYADHAYDRDAEQKLWTMSSDLLGLNVEGSAE